MEKKEVATEKKETSEIEAALQQAKLDKRNVLGDKVPLVEWWDKPFLACTSSSLCSSDSL